VSLTGLIAATTVVSAEEVTYDEIDYAALRLAGQSDQVHAVDQVLLVYREVLHFDEIQYGRSYNEEMLVASIVAGAAVLATDEENASEGATFVFSIAQAVADALEDAGYYEGSEYVRAAEAASPWLANGIKKVLKCSLEALLVWWKCMLPWPFSSMAAKTAWGKNVIAKIGGWLGRYIGKGAVRALGRLIAGVNILITVLCIILAVRYVLKCLFVSYILLARGKASVLGKFRQSWRPLWWALLISR